MENFQNINPWTLTSKGRKNQTCSPSFPHDETTLNQTLNFVGSINEEEKIVFKKIKNIFLYSQIQVIISQHHHNSNWLKYFSCFVFFCCCYRPVVWNSCYHIADKSTKSTASNHSSDENNSQNNMNQKKTFVETSEKKTNNNIERRLNNDGVSSAGSTQDNHYNSV